MALTAGAQAGRHVLNELHSALVFQGVRTPGFPGYIIIVEIELANLFEIQAWEKPTRLNSQVIIADQLRCLGQH